MTKNQRGIQAFHPILHARSSRYYWKGQGSLSIKTFRNGRALYQAGRGTFAVDEGNYLLLNEGQEYSIAIEEDAPVESFCVFFPRNMLGEVCRSLASGHERLLDDPQSHGRGTIEFVERTYGDDPWVAPLMAHMRALYPVRGSEHGWLEEMLHALALALLRVRRQVRLEMAAMTPLKASTREELYRRVHIGHDFLSAHYKEPVTLTEAARAACMSPNHFLRSYKQLFGMSPHQFVTEKRLQEARRLLLATEKSVTDIALEVGYHSPGSFSSLFSRRFSAAPSRFRQKR